MFQDGEKKTISSASRARVTIHGPARRTTAGLHTPVRLGGPNRQSFPHSRTDTDTRQVAGPEPQKRPEKYNPPQHSFSSLPFQQFQVLFNSLFKVLCIFPSRYLFAIGLPPIFSLRWNLPPNSSCNPKQLDSQKTRAKARGTQVITGVSPSLLPCSKGLDSGPRQNVFLQTTIRRTFKLAQIHTVS